MDASAVRDWDEVRPLVLESYRLIAPRRTVAKMDGAVPPKKIAKKAAKTSRARRA